MGPCESRRVNKTTETAYVMFLTFFFSKIFRLVKKLVHFANENNLSNLLKRVTFITSPETFH